MKFILDIETKPDSNLVPIFDDSIKAPANIKDPDKIAAAIEKKKQEGRKTMSVDTDFSDIICVGIKPLGGESNLYSLQELVSFFNDNPDFELITYNGKNFDLPIIIKAGVKQGLDFPYKKLKRLSERYNKEGHYDLMEIIGEYGNYKSLDTLLQIYLGISKQPLDFETASEEEIKKHCLEDLANTEKLYNKFLTII